MTTVELDRAERALQLQRSDSAIEEALRFAEPSVASCSAECRQAVALAVLELGENVLKYAASDSGLIVGTMSIGVEAGIVRVRASNLVGSSEDGQRVVSVVARVSDPERARALYHARLEELFSLPTLPRTELGLLRLAFEGGFSLSCTFDPPTLQVIAARPVSRHDEASNLSCAS